MRNVREKWDLPNNAEVERSVLRGARGAVTESLGT